MMTTDPHAHASQGSIINQVIGDNNKIINYEPSAYGPVPRQLPDPPVGGQLFGRDKPLATLTAWLRRGDHAVVVGPAGFGKTALAAQAVRAVVGEDEAALAASPFPDGVVLLDLYRHKGSSENAWNALANALINDEHDQWPQRQRAEYACRNRRVLIIIEGAEEADGQEGRCTLRELLDVCDPQNRRLVLTRDPTHSRPNQTLWLTEQLDGEAAAALLDQLAGRPVEPQARGAILALLRGHPLALTWAGGLLHHGVESAEQLVGEWRESSLPGLSDPEDSRHTLAWLFARNVRTLNETERAVLTAAGLLAHAEFPLEAMTAALGGDTEARPALRRLVQSGLLRRSVKAGDRWLFTHVLGYQFARQGAEGAGEIRGRLGAWLQSQLDAAAAAEAGPLALALVQAGALLGTDVDQRLWPLAQLCLYEVADGAQDLGRLHLVGLSLRAVNDWLGRLPAQQIEEEFWARERSVLLIKLGDLQQAQGDLAAALESYSASRAVLEKLARSASGNALWQRNLAVSLGKLGDLQQAQGDLDAALGSYSASRTIFEALARSDPGNAQWQRNLAVSLGNLGDLQQAKGDLAAALDSYSASHTIFETLARSDPGNARGQRDLSVSLIKLGDLQQTQGHLAAALGSYSASRAIRETLARSDPGNAQWQRDLSVSLIKLGDLQQTQGDLAAALGCYSTSRAIFETLARSDPGNAQWQRDLSVSLEKLGDLQQAQGDLAAALDSYSASHAIRETLARSDPGNAQWQHDLGVSHEKLGLLRRAQGDLTAALSHLQESCAISKRLARSDPGNAEWQSSLGIGYRQIAIITAQMEHYAVALKFAQASLDIAERLAQLTPQHAQWQRNAAYGRQLVAHLRSCI